MVNVAICDSNNAFRETLKKDLENFCYKKGFYALFRAFKNGEDILISISDNVNFFDIIFLDIPMNGPSGIETANMLRSAGFSGEIIFLTAHPEYVFDSFDSKPTNYILKGTKDFNKIYEVFTHSYKSALNRTSSYIVVRTNTKMHRILAQNIMYCEIIVHDLTIFLKDGNAITFRETLKNFTHKLSKPYFQRCHRSYVVNMMYISMIGAKHIKLFDGTLLPLSDTYKDTIKSSYMSLYSS